MHPHHWAKSPACPQHFPNGFEVKPEGVFSVESDPPKRLTTVPVWVQAVVRTPEGKSWSSELGWIDLDGNTKIAIVPNRDLLRGGGRLEELADHGLTILPGAGGQLARYLILAGSLPGTPRFRLHPSLGFFTLKRGDTSDELAFMLPNECLRPVPKKSADAEPSEGDPEDELEDQPEDDLEDEQEDQSEDDLEDDLVDEPKDQREDDLEDNVEDEPIIFHPHEESEVFSAYRPAGTLGEWQAAVHPLATNPLLVFALSVGFSSPFVALGDMDNVIFHLFGQSSTGKTTALQLAVSVWGQGGDPERSPRGRTVIERWNSTQNALEPIAAAHSGLLLAIDEIGSSNDTAVSIYNTTSGLGKKRMNKQGGMREQSEWSLCILSTGEFSMQDKIEETEKRKAKTGEMIRAMDIPVAALAHDPALSLDEQRILIARLKEQCSESFGTAGPAFIQDVLDTFPTETKLRGWLKKTIDKHQTALIDKARASGRDLGPAHLRALRRFAFVAAIGSLASVSEKLPFTKKQIVKAVQAVSDAWLSAVPFLSEGERALHALRDYIVRNTAKIFDVDSSQIPQDLRGIRKGDLLLFTQDLLEQACGGIPVREAVRYFCDQGMLQHEKEKLTYRVDIAELGYKRFPFYAIHRKKLLTGSDAALSVEGQKRLLEEEADL